MAYDKVIDSAQLEADLTTVADAIRAKGETTEPLAFPDGYKSAIESIEVGVDTSDATATASDIAQNKTAYVNGEKVTGTVYEYDEDETLDYTSVGSSEVTTGRVYSSAGVHFTIQMRNNYLIRKGSFVKIGAKLNNFGAATASDVVKGKTFTSTAGLEVTGTYEPPVSAGGVSF